MRKLSVVLLLMLVWLIPLAVTEDSSVFARPSCPRIEQAEAAYAQLSRVLSSGRVLEPSDIDWIGPMNETFGKSQERPGGAGIPRALIGDTPLSITWLNQHREVLVAWRNALAAMIEASRTPAYSFAGEGYKLPAANAEIAKLLRSRYDQASFERLYAAARAHQVFDIQIDKHTGLVGTSGVSSSENAEMSERQWVTDTVRVGALEKVVCPQAYSQALQTLAKFYCNTTEQAAFAGVISNPDSYRQGPPSVGVAHIFYPNTLQRDPSWFNNQRLESHGLALWALAEALQMGMVKDNAQGWGMTSASDDVVTAIGSLTAYFVALDYSSARSAGNWEETPFAGGLTWDTEAIRRALVAVHDLIYNPSYDKMPAVVQLRQRLAQGQYAEYLDKSRLEQQIERGLARVRKTYTAESPGQREMDSSLVFLACSEVTLADCPIESVGKMLDMLDTVESSLVRDYGMIRYAPFTVVLNNGQTVKSPDSYLSLNYNIACNRQGQLDLDWKAVLDDFGSKDASDPEVFAARAKLSAPNAEAQWFMVSDLARGYANQAKLVMQAVNQRKPCQGQLNMTSQERALFLRAYAGATRNINRAYARLTSDSVGVKANGLECPTWAVPEAWQAVSNVDQQINYLPGVNTPLSWAKASLWEASESYAELLKMVQSVP